MPRTLLLALAATLLLVRPSSAAEPWDAAPFTADPKALLEAAQKVDPGRADAIALLDEAIYSADGSPQWHATTHAVYRVVTEKGVKGMDTVAERWAPWFGERPLIRARVVAKDGTVYTLDPKDVTEAAAAYQRDIFSDTRIVHAPLPGVAAGSIIEVVKEQTYKSIVPGQGMSGVFFFGMSIPEEHERVVIEEPAGAPEPKILNKTGLEPRIVERDGRKQWIFESGHAAAVRVDEWYLAPDDFLDMPYLAFTTSASWGDLARQYAGIVDKRIAASDVRETAAAVTRGAAGQKEIVDRLVAWIAANVHYAGVEIGDGSIVPRPPNVVIAKKYGDCKDKATLLVALLRAAGIPAHVALLNAGGGRDAFADLPGLTSFNHAIVVAGAGTPVWIDPTDEFARAGELPIEDQGRLALIAAAETTAPVRTPDLPSSANHSIQTRTFTLPEEGKAAVVEIREGIGRADAQLRRGYAETDTAKYKATIEKYTAASYDAPKTDKFTAGDPRDFTKPFFLTLELSGAKAGLIANGEGRVQVSPAGLFLEPWLMHEYEAPREGAPARKRRTRDFFFPEPALREWRCRIILPQGYTARALPPNETKQFGTTTLTKEFGTDGHGVVFANFRYDSGKRRLTPAEFEETRLALSRALVLRPIEIRLISTGQAKLNGGDVRGALEEFRRLAAAHPKEAQHHIELARALLHGGLGEAARNEARRAVALEPSSAAAHGMLARTLQNDLLGRPFHRGCDLPAALAERKKSAALDRRDLQQRAELAELCAYGTDRQRFGRNAHLAEGIAEYQSIVALGNEGKAYQPRLVLFLAHAGRWDDARKVVDGMEDGEQKTLGRLLVEAATNGAPAALRELEAAAAEQRRRYAADVAQTLMSLSRYPEAAAMFESAAQEPLDPARRWLIAVLKKARRGGPADDGTPRAAAAMALRAVWTSDAALLRSVLPQQDDPKNFRIPRSFSVRSLTFAEVRAAVFADLILAGADIQTEGDDAAGYRVRVRLFTPAGQHSMGLYVVREGAKYVVADSGLGQQVMKFAAAGDLDRARRWLNWAREESAAIGGDDPLARPPFSVVWPRDKAAATADEIRLGAALLMTGREAVPALLAARDKATDEQKTWIDVALTAAYGEDAANVAEVAGRLAAAYPQSERAFSTWTNALAKLGKVDEAEAAAKNRLATSPRSREALHALSRTAARKGDYTAAYAYERRIVTGLTPTETDYNQSAWIALFAGKDLDQAIDDARRASTYRSANGATYLHTLAALYAETGKSAEARQALLQAIEWRSSDTPDSGDWYVVGRIAENYGEIDAALAAYKRVEKKPPPLSTFELAERRQAALTAKK